MRILVGGKNIEFDDRICIEGQNASSLMQDKGALLLLVNLKFCQCLLVF